MKTSMLTAALSRKFSRFAIPVAIFVATISIASAAGAAGGNPPQKAGATRIKSLREQICQYIDINDSSLKNLRSGIVVISFSVDENNRLKEVESHSRIPSLDQYLKSTLEGKVIMQEDVNEHSDGQQFVRLRFSIEK